MPKEMDIKPLLRDAKRQLHDEADYLREGSYLSRYGELLADAQVTILSERRIFAPYGLAGGEPGRPGRNVLIRDGEEQALPGKTTLAAQAGDVISVQTPGGGGWGAAIPDPTGAP